jgi:hypothetical protein
LKGGAPVAVLCSEVSAFREVGAEIVQAGFLGLFA